MHGQDGATIKSCYNVGDLINIENKVAGGIFYDGSDCIFENNFWLDGCGADFGCHHQMSNVGAEPKSSVDMKGLSTTLGSEYYAQDDNINDGYPYLKNIKYEKVND